MLIFAISDKGGTGRSVTSANLLYRLALQGKDVCYLDFDFGSPTVGAIFGISQKRGAPEGSGLHSYLREGTTPIPVDIWVAAERETALQLPTGAARLVLYPGEEGGGDLSARDMDAVGLTARCVELFQRVDEEFDITLVDLSAGRTYALDLVLKAAGTPELSRLAWRWIVFLRWTEQHIIAAHGLVFGAQGIIDMGQRIAGLDKHFLRGNIRFARTAVLDLNSEAAQTFRPQQAAWLYQREQKLRGLAREKSIGPKAILGSIPLDPVLQWQERLISDEDAYLDKIANIETVEALESLAAKLLDDNEWGEE